MLPACEIAKKGICARYGVEYVASPLRSISGFARQTLGRQPINGLRHGPVEGTSGWYIWCGDWSDSSDFYQPTHTEHIERELPEIADLLGLPPGYRFLKSGDYLDVWFDTTLIS